jgi:hypothetical protein
LIFFFDDDINDFSFRFQYTPSTSWFGLSTTGQVSVYDQGGYIQTFGSSQEEFLAEIEVLKDK